MIHREEVLFKGPANLIKNIEAVGGNIEITDKSILFESHVINIQSGATSIPLEHISHYKLGNSLGFIPNKLTIVTKKGIEYKFVVSKRKEITKILDDILQVK